MSFAIVKQTDVSERSRGWAEWSDGESPLPIAHRTKAGAEAAMIALVPEGKDPWIYAGLLIEKCPRFSEFGIVEDV